MTFPVLEDYTIKIDASADQSHTAEYPTGIENYDLLIGMIGIDDGGGGTIGSWPTGWTEEREAQDQSTVIASMAYKWADGTETGTFEITHTTTEYANSIILRISGVDPNFLDFAFATGSTDTPDAPNLAPAAGGKDYLWLAMVTIDHIRTISATPSNMTGTQDNGQSPAVGGCTVIFDFAALA